MKNLELKYTKFTESPIIEENSVHICLAKIEANENYLNHIDTILNEDEIKKAERFRFDEHRNRFKMARGTLRILISKYIKNINPEDIRISYNKYGKPELSMDKRTKDIKFNLSYSGNYAILAFALSRRVGIDIEKTHEIKYADQILERFIPNFESNKFRELPYLTKISFFFSTWTCIEAYQKALGIGLSSNKIPFEIQATDNYAEAKLLFGESNYWSLIRFKPSDTCWAAVAAEGQNLTFKYYNIDLNELISSIETNQASLSILV